MNNIGLVFAGGGGKGAYQIGVWKYLHEYGIDNHICAVSGTSVGALNAALFASGDFYKAEQLWLNITPNQILTPKKISISDITKWIGQMGLISAIPTLAVGAVSLVGSTATTLISNMIRQSYSFSRDGLISVMQDGVDFLAIQQSAIPCYATCLKLPDFSLSRFDLRDYTSEDTQKILLASSAIPMVFDPVKFQGSQYYDGGIPVVGDNVPIHPIYEMGARTIIVVHLAQDAVIDHDRYPDVKIIEIVPQDNLGGTFDGMLDFTSAGAKRRMEQGYQDACKIFAPLLELLVLQKCNEEALMGALQKQSQFNAKHQELNDRLSSIKAEMKSDGFDELLENLSKESH